MSPPPGLARAVLVLLAGGGLVAGASLTSGSVEIAAPHERAGLPARSNVLVDDASLVCPGQQRVGAAGLKSVAGTVEAAVAAPPAGTLPALGPTTADSGAGSPAAGGPAAAAGSPAAGRLTLQSLSGGPVLAAADSRGTSTDAEITATDGVLARGSGPLAPGLVATQTWLRLGDDERGLSVTPCSTPAADLWLVGGGGGPSRTERLVLGNPGANAVTVSFEVLGAAGAVAGAEGISETIPPRSRTVVSLDSMALTEASPVVHVVATGGVVSGVLTDAWIEGATGRGTDDASPSAAPGRDQVIPGLAFGGPTLVRIANTGSREALVQVRLLGPDGVDQPTELRAVRVPARSTKDVALGKPGAGAQAVRLVADQPVVAGAMEQRVAATGADRMGDFGWAPAAGPIRGVAGLLLPGLAQRRTVNHLLLASATGGVATVTMARGAGTTSTSVTLGPDRARRLALGDADRVWVTPKSGDVRAAVSVTGSDAQGPLLSIAPLTSAPVTALSVPVRQVRN